MTEPIRTNHPMAEPNKSGFWHTKNTSTRVNRALGVEVGFHDQFAVTYVKLAPGEAYELAGNLIAAANEARPKE